MGKVLLIEDDERLDKSHLGCMSGTFHAFDYRYWLSKRVKRNKRISNDDQDPFEVTKLFNSKTSHILVDQDFVSSPKLQRTNSIHHLETNEWVHPIIFFPENVTECKTSSKTHVNHTNPEICDSRDVLDIFEVDKELFINALQDRSLSLDTKPKQTKLTKSGSFPTASKSVRRNLMPMKLKDKLNEICTISKVEKTRNSNDDVNSKNVIRLRRISSVNESASRFPDFSVGKEVTLRHCRSLKSNFTAFSEDAYALIIEDDSYQFSGKITQESSVLFPEYRPQDEKVQILRGFQKNVDEFKTINNKKPMKLPTKDDDFTYVKKILEHSGFINNGFQQPWYSSNQPLDRFMFQEIESRYFHDPERFAEEVIALSHRLLIFDLVDEVLVTMYERSLTYYQRKLPSLCQILLACTTGSCVLDEVWNCVSWLLNFKHDINESLNDIVSRDLRSDDGWMNMQLDFECVGLDLDDLILNEVLEEVVFKLI